MESKCLKNTWWLLSSIKSYQTSTKAARPAPAGMIKRYTTCTSQEGNKKCTYLRLLGKQDSASCKSSYALSQKWLHYSGVAGGSDCATTLADTSPVWTGSLAIITLPPSVSKRSTILKTGKQSSPQKLHTPCNFRSCVSGAQLHIFQKNFILLTFKVEI